MSLSELAKKSGDAIAVHYVSLDDLSDTFLDGNSKKHDLDKLIDSIQRYGFSLTGKKPSILPKFTSQKLEVKSQKFYLFLKEEDSRIEQCFDFFLINEKASDQLRSITFDF